MYAGSRSPSLARIAVVTLLLAGCAGPGGPAQSGGTQSGGASPGPQRARAVTIGVTSNVVGMTIIGDVTSVGGWPHASDVYSNGLITSDFDSRKPIGRLAERAPSTDDGSISLLPDGRMRVVYQIRKGVTWQDGAPFTARDLLFSYRLNTDPGVPYNQRDAIGRMESVEAPDDYTFVVNFKGPYYLGGSLGVRLFWPQPQHLLGDAFERYQTSKNSDDILNLPYWTSEYVHLGPFRLTSFDAAEGLTFQAYDQYFLGRPKLDTVYVRLFGDQNGLFANLLAGTVDLFLESTIQSVELGDQLTHRWHDNNEGAVYPKQVSHRFLAPQWRPNVLTELANLDVRVRAALYRALDRQALNDGLQPGHPDLVAWAILPPNDLYYLATKDAMRPYAYDPARAKADLADLGWMQGPDGALRHRSDGRRFRNAISATGGITPEVPAYADYWRRIGIEVEEIAIPTSQVRNAEYRALFPSWEASAQGGGDGILGRLQGPAATAQTRWVGNRGGYDDPRTQTLIEGYRASISQTEQFQAMKAISDLVAAELPILVLFGTADYIGVRKGVKAFDDEKGGGGGPYGTHTRNAHLWDVE